MTEPLDYGQMTDGWLNCEITKRHNGPWGVGDQEHDYLGDAALTWNAFAELTKAAEIVSVFKSLDTWFCDADDESAYGPTIERAVWCAWLCWQDSKEATQ